MADRKLFAGHAVRRLRRQMGLTQAAMAEALDVSPSYLNLVERNQRPLSASLMLRLAETYDFDPRTLAASEPGGGAEAMRRRLADPAFADLEIDRHQLEEWLAGAPGGAEAFARAYDRMGRAPGPKPRQRIPAARCAARSSAGAIISPIWIAPPRRWPTN
jgi:transcriptional regulator with XRE-family HTH domain